MAVLARNSQGTPPCRLFLNRYINWFAHARPAQASVAQLAEQLICNQQVVGSSPSASSSARTGAGRERRVSDRFPDGLLREQPTLEVVRAISSSINAGGFPERSKGSDCKSDGTAFTGSNPVPPTDFVGRARTAKRATGTSSQDSRQCAAAGRAVPHVRV